MCTPCRRLRSERQRGGADLSREADPDRRRLRAGRAGRRHGAAHRATRVVDPRAKRGHRQPAGRRRHHRCARRRRVGSGRLHAAARQYQHPRHQPADLQERELRPGQRLRADRDARDNVQSADRQSGARRHIGAGAHRARPRAPGQAQLFVGRDRHASAPDRGNVQAAARSRRGACPLQGRRTVGAGRGRGRNPVLVRKSGVVAAAGPGRQCPGAGVDQRDARFTDPRSADHDRSRRARFHIGLVHGGGGARGHARGHRGQAQRRHQREPEIRRDRQHPHQAQRRRQDHLAGGVRGLPRPGARQVDDGDQDRRRAGGMTAP